MSVESEIFSFGRTVGLYVNSCTCFLLKWFLYSQLQMIRLSIVLLGLTIEKTTNCLLSLYDIFLVTHQDRVILHLCLLLFFCLLCLLLAFFHGRLEFVQATATKSKMGFYLLWLWILKFCFIKFCFGVNG